MNNDSWSQPLHVTTRSANMARPILPRTTSTDLQSQAHHPPDVIMGQYQHSVTPVLAQQHVYNFSAPSQNMRNNGTTSSGQTLANVHHPEYSTHIHLTGQPSASPATNDGITQPSLVGQPTPVLNIRSEPYDTLNLEAPSSNPHTEGINHQQPLRPSHITVPQVRFDSTAITHLPSSNAQANNVVSSIRRNRNGTPSTRGRGRSYRARGSRSLRGRGRNLLPNVFRSRSVLSRSNPSSTTAIPVEWLSFQEMLRMSFQQQNDVMQSIRDSIIETTNMPHTREIIRDGSDSELPDTPDNMTTLSNCLCLLFQLFILSSFVGKAPLWFIFPINEKESDVLKLCTNFFVPRDDDSGLSLEMEQITIEEFLDGDTIYGRNGVRLWKHRGEVSRKGKKKEISSLRNRLRRLRSRVHDEMTRMALQCFFSQVPEFHKLRVGSKYSSLPSSTVHNALKYCLDKQNLGSDPLTDGTWKLGFTEAHDTLMAHARQRIREVYGKLEDLLSTRQMISVSSYFKTYYFHRYRRSIPLLSFEFHRRTPAILEAYVSTKVRCRLADIATWIARKKRLSHSPFFEVSHCESHFIPILADLINLTNKQNGEPLDVLFGYGSKCEQISEEESNWAKSQYDRIVTGSSHSFRNSENDGLNLLASMIDSATEEQDETSEDTELVLELSNREDESDI